jgi:hypothetical protein
LSAPRAYPPAGSLGDDAHACHTKLCPPMQHARVRSLNATDYDSTCFSRVPSSLTIKNSGCNVGSVPKVHWPVEIRVTPLLRTQQVEYRSDAAYSAASATLCAYYGFASSWHVFRQNMNGTALVALSNVNGMAMYRGKYVVASGPESCCTEGAGACSAAIALRGLLSVNVMCSE